MAASMRFVAAIGGIGVAFVFVMLVTALSPDPDVESGKTDVVFERFAFLPAERTVAAGTTVTVVNEGLVPVTLWVDPPQGENASFPLAPGAERALRLDLTGTYGLAVAEYGWASAEIEVRTANAFVRFFEDLF